jgi:4-hydroxy-tetrahydrodipicolinate synthase
MKTAPSIEYDTSDRIGAACALTTAFLPDNSVDVARTVNHARRVLGTGANRIALFGTTGEGPSIDTDERRTLLEASVEAGVEPGRIIVGLSSATVGEAARQWRIARDVGAGMVLVPPPFYYKGVSDEGLYRWYADVIASAGDGACRMILYTIPSVTAVPLSSSLIGRLKTDFPEIVAAVKDSTGDFSNTSELLETHGDLQILVGHEPDLGAMVGKGAGGSISGLANIMPGTIAGIVADGSTDARIGTFVDTLLKFPVTPAVKALVAHVHGDPAWLHCRPPLTRLTSVEADALCAEYDRLFGVRGAGTP